MTLVSCRIWSGECQKISLAAVVSLHTIVPTTIYSSTTQTASAREFKGATRPGATRLRASEREILPLRGFLRGPLKTAQKSLKASENL